MASAVSFWKNLVRWQKNILALACVLTIYALLGFFCVPRLGHYILENQVADFLQRQVRVEEIRCNPFALTLDLRSLSITDKNSTKEFIGLDGLHLDLELSSLWQLALVLRDIRLEGPRLHICLDEQGQLNFADLVTGSEEPSEPTRTTPLPLIIEPFVLEQGAITFTDNMHNSTHVVDRIDFRVPHISSRQKDWKTFMTPALSFQLNGAPFMLQGRTIPFDNSLKTQFDLDGLDLDLSRYWSYVPVVDDLRLVAGTLALNLSLIFEQHAGGLPTFSLSGHILGQDINLADETGSVLTAPRLEIALEDISVLKQHVVVQNISVDQPLMRVVRHQDETLNWTRYFAAANSGAQNSTDRPESAAQNSTDPSPDQDSIFMFLVRNAQIKNGHIEVLDETRVPTFTKELRELNLQLTNLATDPKTQARAELNLGTGENEHLNATAVLTLSPFALTASISAQDLELPSYAPFFETALPLTLTTAKAEARATIFLAQKEQEARITNASLALRDLSLVGPEKTGSISVQRIHLDSINVDLAAQNVQTGMLGVEEMTLATAVDAQGRARLLQHLAAQTAAPPATSTQNDHEILDWTVNMDGISLRNTSLQTTGKTATRPVHLKNLGVGALLVETKTRQAKIGPIDLTLATNLVLQKNNSLDLANLFATDAPPSRAKTDDAPFSVSIERLKIADSVLEFTDATLARPLRLNVDQVKIQAEKLSTDLGQSIPLSLSCRLDKTGIVQIKGDLIPDSVRGQGEITLDKLPVSLASAYLADLADIKITSGQLAGAAKWQLDTQGKGHIKGNLQLNNLRVTEGKSKTEICSWQNLALHELDLRLAPLALRVGRVDLTAPKAGFSIDKQGKTTLDRVLVPTNAKQTAAPAQKPGPAPQLEIGPLAIKQGRFSFVDKTISPQFETLITPLDLTLSGFSLDPAKHLELDLRAVIDGSAPFTAQGWIAPGRATLAANSTVSLHGFDLTSLSAYAAKFVAHPITKGHLDWEMHINTVDSTLTMGNAITAKQLELGHKVASEDALDVPVKLGLSLLRDLSGNIKINLPVKGDLRDPKFSIGSIVLQAFLGLIVKAIASPFTLLAGLLPAGADQDLSKILFPPGLSEPAPETMPILQGMADIMSQRPAIALTLVGRAATDADRQELEELQFLRKLQTVKFADLSRREKSQTSPDDLSITEEEYADLLWTAYKNEPVDKEKNFLGVHKEVSREEQEEKLREHIDITDDDLLKLASERAKFVQDYLVEQGVDPGRVELGPLGPASLAHTPEVTLETRQ